MSKKLCVDITNANIMTDAVKRDKRSSARTHMPSRLRKEGRLGHDASRSDARFSPLPES